MFEILFLAFSNVLIFVIIIFSFMVVVPINIIRHYIMGFDIGEYLYGLLKAFDQLGRAMIYGTEDYTISSWTYYLHSKGNKYATYFMKFIDTLALGIAYILYTLKAVDEKEVEWNKHHCENSYKDETKALYEKSKAHLQ